jgi:capsular polysaccharide biosynthesis protein
LLLALIAGLGGAVGVVFLSDHLDESIRTVAEAERRLQLRVFATLPCVVSPLPNLPKTVSFNELRRSNV